MGSKKWNGYVDDLVFGILSFNDMPNLLYELGSVVYYCDHQSSLPRIKQKSNQSATQYSPTQHPASQPSFLIRLRSPPLHPPPTVTPPPCLDLFAKPLTAFTRSRRSSVGWHSVIRGSPETTWNETSTLAFVTLNTAIYLINGWTKSFLIPFDSYKSLV